MMRGDGGWTVYLEREWLQAPIDWGYTSPRPEMSREDIVSFLGRGTPRRFKTLYNGLLRLPPGFALASSRDGSVQPVRRWSALDAAPQYSGFTLEERAAKLRELLTASVIASAAGKRVGLLLSGGYDSTLLATLVANQGISARCYTVTAPGRYPSEWEHASETAQRLHLPARQIVVTLADLLGSVAVMKRLKNTPNVCWVTANQLAAARAAVEDGCEVLLQGTGSDELFGPATGEVETVWNFQRKVASAGVKQAWSALLGERSKERSFLLHKGNISPFSAAQLQELFPGVDVTAALEDDIVEFYRELQSQHPESTYESLTLQLELEMRSSDVILQELSTASQLHGIRAAFPFYERSIVELAAGTPLAMKAHCESGVGYLPQTRTYDWANVVNKYLVRYAFREIVPEAVNRRPRLAYTLPFSWWMRGEDREALARAIETSSVWQTLGMDVKRVLQYAREDLGQGSLWEAPLRFCTNWLSGNPATGPVSR